jgi:hypothetical protein
VLPVIEDLWLAQADEAAVHQDKRPGDYLNDFGETRAETALMHGWLNMSRYFFGVFFCFFLCSQCCKGRASTARQGSGGSSVDSNEDPTRGCQIGSKYPNVL